MNKILHENTMRRFFIGENLSINRLRNTVGSILSSTGVNIDGNNPWDIQILNENFFKRVLSQGSLGLGESYMDKWWDCEKLDEFFIRSFVMISIKR